MIQNENSHQPARPLKKKRRLPPPLTTEELLFLKEKRFIDEWDLIRFLQISQSTMYNWIKLAYLVPSHLGGKKYFDLNDIFRRLEEGKGKGKI